MQSFLIALEMNLEGNSKQSFWHTLAKTEEQAGVQALTAEAGHDISDADFNGANQIEDPNNNYIYTVTKITAVDDAQFDALKTLLPYRNC
jgi:hypothetical protein